MKPSITEVSFISRLKKYTVNVTANTPSATAAIFKSAFLTNFILVLLLTTTSRR